MLLIAGGWTKIIAGGKTGWLERCLRRSRRQRLVGPGLCVPVDLAGAFALWVALDKMRCPWEYMENALV